MKVIIAGSRSITSFDAVLNAIQWAQMDITEVVSGGAKGVDALGERWAKLNEVPIKRFLPDWKQFGKSAGPRRNEQMAQYADGLIAVWDGKSRGTEHMIETARRVGLEVYVSRANNPLK